MKPDSNGKREKVGFITIFAANYLVVTASICVCRPKKAIKKMKTRLVVKSRTRIFFHSRLGLLDGEHNYTKKHNSERKLDLHTQYP